MALIAGLHVAPYTLPLAAPIRTARVSMDRREGWWLRVTTACGREGFGDVCPWPGFVDAAPDEVTTALTRLTGTTLIDRSVQTLVDVEAIAAHLSNVWVRAGLELALLDILGQEQGRPISRLLGMPGPERVRVAAAVATPEAADRAGREGADVFKIKVGTGTVNEEVSRVQAVAGAAVKACGGTPTFRLDANRAWDVSTAEDAIAKFADLGLSIEWIEEPVASSGEQLLADLARLRGTLPLAVDESVGFFPPGDHEPLGHRLNDLLCVADVAVIKPPTLGGLLPGRRAIQAAQAQGKRVCVGGVWESAIGRAGALHLAATLERGTAAGLSSPLAEDVAPLEARGWKLAPPTTPGLGLTFPVGPVTDPGPAPTRPRPPALPNPLRATAIARPDHPWFVAPVSSPWGTLTAREAWDKVSRRAGALAAFGLGPGDRVRLTGDDRTLWALNFFALGTLGATVIPGGPDSAGAPGDDHQISTDEDFTLGDPVSPRPWPLDEVRVILSTSGSTGAPKPVPLTTGQLVFGAMGSALRLGHHPEDRWLACLPLHHIGGLSILTRCAWYGTTVQLVDRFEPRAVAALLDSGDITQVSLVPTMLSRILDARPEVPFPERLRFVLLGGAPAPADLLARCDALGVPLARTWGMTETASQVATAFVGTDRYPPLSFASVHANEDGALCVEGPLVATPLVTRDAGRVDPTGAVQVTGRLDDVVITGGVNVDPRTIEKALAEHPAIKEVAVFGVPCPDLGQKVTAAVVGTGAPRPSDDDLRDWARRRLPRASCPRSFLWLDALPRTAMGKIQRTALVGYAHAHAGEPLTELGRSAPGFESLRIDEGVHGAKLSPRTPVLPEHLVDEGDRALRQTLHPHHDLEPIPEADRSSEVGLRVDQGRPPVSSPEDILEPAEGSDEHLLVRRVAVLKETTKEDNASPVDLVEPSGQAVLKTHSQTPAGPDETSPGRRTHHARS